MDWEQGEVGGREQNNETLDLLFSPFPCSCKSKNCKSEGDFWMWQISSYSTQQLGDGLHVCWAGICTFVSQLLLVGSFQQGGGLSTICPSDYPIPSLNGWCEGVRIGKSFQFSHALSFNWYLELFLTLFFNSGVFLPIGQKTDKCDLGLANKSIKIVKPSAKRKVKFKKRVKGMSKTLQCNFN